MSDMIKCTSCDLHEVAINQQFTQTCGRIATLSPEMNSDWAVLIINPAPPKNEESFISNMVEFLDSPEIQFDRNEIPIFTTYAVNCPYASEIKKEHLIPCAKWLREILVKLNRNFDDIVILAMGTESIQILDYIGTGKPTKDFNNNVKGLINRDLRLRFAFTMSDDSDKLYGNTHKVFISYGMSAVYKTPQTREIAVNSFNEAHDYIEVQRDNKKKDTFVPHAFHTVMSKSDVHLVREELFKLARLNGKLVTSFDIESNNTLSGYRPESRIVSYSITYDKDGILQSWCFPVNHSEIPRELSAYSMVFLRWYARQEKLIKITHNGLFDIPFCMFKTIKEWKSWNYDTYVLAQLVGEPKGFRSLKFLAKKFCGISDWTEKIADDEGHKDFINSAFEVIAEYNNVDTLSTYLLFFALKTYLFNTLAKKGVDANLMWKLFDKQISRFQYTIAHIMFNGIAIDNEIKDRYEKIYQDEVSLLESELYSRNDIKNFEEEYLNDDFILWRDDYETWLESPQPKGGVYSDGSIKINATRRSDPVYTKLNFQSPKQLALFAIDYLNLPVVETTKTGQTSMSKEVMDKYALINPAFSQILRRRRVIKELGTYITPLYEFTGPTGRVHPAFNLGFTDSGRLSCERPNLQNVKSRGHVFEDYIVKDIYAVPKDWLLVSLDASQAELRVLACESQDKAMINAFNSGEDIHRATGSLLFNVAIEEVTKDQRFIGKTTNFGIVYLMGFGSLAETIFESLKSKWVKKKLSNEEAEKNALEECKEILSGLMSRVPNFNTKEPWNPIIHQKFYDLAQYVLAAHEIQFPGVWKFIADMKKYVYKYGRSYSPLGRICCVPNIFSYDKRIQGEAMRTAINAPTQGTAADIVCDRASDVLAEIQRTGKESTRILCNTVHDSLFLQMKIDKYLVQDIKTYWEICEDMSNFDFLKVPMPFDIEFGPSWGKLKEYESDKYTRDEILNILQKISDETLQ